MNIRTVLLGVTLVLTFVMSFALSHSVFAASQVEDITYERYLELKKEREQKMARAKAAQRRQAPAARPSPPKAKAPVLRSGLRGHSPRPKVAYTPPARKARPNSPGNPMLTETPRTETRLRRVITPPKQVFPPGNGLLGSRRPQPRPATPAARPSPPKVGSTVSASSGRPQYPPEKPRPTSSGRPQYPPEKPRPTSSGRPQYPPEKPAPTPIFVSPAKNNSGLVGGSSSYNHSHDHSHDHLQGSHGSGLLGTSGATSRPPMISADPTVLMPLCGCKSKYCRVTSPFRGDGRPDHNGVDFGAPEGQDVRAVADGEVIIAHEGSATAGNFIAIRHSGPLEKNANFGNEREQPEGDYVTKYMHLSKLYVSKGDRVLKGQVIGAVGATGRANGSHLHLELLVGGLHVNPMDYLEVGSIVYSKERKNTAKSCPAKYRNMNQPFKTQATRR